MEEKLKTIFSNVNEWLKFAEAKNGVLVTLNGAIIFAFLSIFSNKLVLKGIDCRSFEFVLRIFCWEFVVFSFLSLIISLLSFFPQTKKKLFWFPSETPKPYDNALFFGDIQKYTSLEFLNLISENSQNEYSKMERYYASQIVTNSIITHRKLKYFKLALLFTISSVTSIFGGIILYYLFNPND